MSQNFLADVETLEAILEAAAPPAGRRVLEIGPGLGILTGALLDAGATVTAVELDPGMVRFLRERFAVELERGAAEPGAPGTLRLVGRDFLDEDLADLATPPYDVVANLPYHVTSPVLHRLLGTPGRPERMVLMLQREVAERIAARPGGLSYLAVFCQFHARVRIVRIVPAAAFAPPPKVDSAVVVLAPWHPGRGEPAPSDAPPTASDDAPGTDAGAPPILDAATEDALWRLVQAAFRERRKMLRNVLVRQLPVPPERIADALATAGIADDRRPQTVSVAEWLALLGAVGPIGPDRRGRREGPGRPDDDPDHADASPGGDDR
jgi:16S rRNA (adenine1518-N6/adenine1519-N6)-dimethyltransferase